MRFLAKNLVLFVFLSIALLSFTGCRSSSTKPANTQGNTKTSDYPALPTSIMQAEIKALDDTAFKLEDYKGKVILVNFWATWCGPCKAEMPELVKLQNEHQENGFEVIGVDADENEIPEIIKIFGETMNINYKLTKPNEKLYNEFQKISRFSGIPQSFLIDREGKLNAVYFGAGQNTIEKIKEDVGRVVNAN